jgi:LysR family transcriptional regulator, glycine cleavage system transcriptional activator
MARRLPPLKALPDFEAAARHLSFTKAAGELHVTHGAVSRQVKGLEDYLGVRLFRRMNRALLLTDEGQAYLPAIREMLDRLGEATERVKQRDRAGGLTVSTTASFAAKWLVTRLSRFRDAHPEIDVRLQANDNLADFARDGVDIAIRYGQGRYPGLEVERLMSEDYAPVCSPKLLKGPHGLRRPADLRNHALLHEDGSEIDWRMWLMAAGVSGVDLSRGVKYSHSSLVIQAAIAGEGVALGRSALITEDLAAKRLVRPFDIQLKAALAYYVVLPPGSLARPKVAAFRDWLLAEAARERDPSSETARSESRQGDAHMGDAHMGDAHVGDSHMGDSTARPTRARNRKGRKRLETATTPATRSPTNARSPNNE